MLYRRIFAVLHFSIVIALHLAVYVVIAFAILRNFGHSYFWAFLLLTLGYLVYEGMVWFYDYLCRSSANG